MVKNEKRMVSMCSSKQRPERLKEMITGWINTVQSEDPLLVVYVSETDPKLKEYEALALEITDKRIDYGFGREKTMVQVLNDYCQKFNGFGYFHEINDDHIPRSIGWDKELMTAVDSKNAGYTIAYGKTQNMPSSVMFGGKLVRVLGYMFPPQFKHTYVDNWLMSLGQSANLFAYVPSAYIEHMHPLFGLAKTDPVYQQVFNDTDNGKVIFQKLLMDMPQVTKKIIEMIKAECPGMKADAQALIDYERAEIPPDYEPGHKDWDNPGKYAWRGLWLRVNGMG